MKLIIMLILLVPVLIFQVFILSDSITIFMKTKKGATKTNNIYLRNENLSRKTNFRVVK